ENSRRSVAEQLERQLGPEFISKRPGQGGRKLSYVEGCQLIRIANKVFGYDGWNTSVRDVTVDFLDNVNGGLWNIGVTVKVRITLRGEGVDGAYREDLGYGVMDNARTKAQALEKAKKEATTDAIKRCFRQFGDVLGNCVYDKGYLEKIDRV
ncbi:DNA repair protein Rad52/59/22, partial [Sphaerosporella brunnea]